MKTKIIEISEEEAIALMVGMAEFEHITAEKEVFKSYGKISNELCEKFRGIVWDFTWEKQEKNERE